MSAIERFHSLCVSLAHTYVVVKHMQFCPSILLHVKHTSLTCILQLWYLCPSIDHLFTTPSIHSTTHTYVCIRTVIIYFLFILQLISAQTSYTSAGSVVSPPTTLRRSRTRSGSNFTSGPEDCQTGTKLHVP